MINRRNIAASMQYYVLCFVPKYFVFDTVFIVRTKKFSILLFFSSSQRRNCSQVQAMIRSKYDFQFFWIEQFFVGFKSIFFGFSISFLKSHRVHVIFKIEESIVFPT